MKINTIPVTHNGQTEGAEFNRQRTHRFSLWRFWPSLFDRSDTHQYSKPAMFIGLNPSTADEVKNDPTVRRCINYAKEWGYAGLVMMNLFGYRSTDPRGLKTVLDPVGRGHDEHLVQWAKRSGIIICAWGVHGILDDRDLEVVELLRRNQFRLHCLGTTKHGHPKHPLYLRADLKPQEFDTSYLDNRRP